MICVESAFSISFIQGNIKKHVRFAYVPFNSSYESQKHAFLQKSRSKLQKSGSHGGLFYCKHNVIGQEYVQSIAVDIAGKYNITQVAYNELM